MKENKTSGKGIGFIGLLSLAFIILKLCGVISWSWLWVLSPIWISAAIGVLSFIVWVVLIVADKAGEKNNGR